MQTWLGPILVFVNPYSTQGQLDERAQLMSALAAAATVPATPATVGGPPVAWGHVAPMVPHVYALAGAAYAAMVEEHTNQTVIITGESGAGTHIPTLADACLSAIVLA
jgi:myosin heavy subunit